MRSFLPLPVACGLWLAVILAARAASPTPAPTSSPAPDQPLAGKLSLVRYDMPLAFSDGYAPTHQAAKHKDGEVEVAWPEMTLDGKPIFRGKSEEQIPLKLHRGADA